MSRQSLTQRSILALLLLALPAAAAPLPRAVCLERCAPLFATDCGPRHRLACQRRMLRRCRHNLACPPTTTSTTSTTSTTTTTSTSTTTLPDCPQTPSILGWFYCCCTTEHFGHGDCTIPIEQCYALGVAP